MKRNLKTRVPAVLLAVLLTPVILLPAGMSILSVRADDGTGTTSTGGSPNISTTSSDRYDIDIIHADVSTMSMQQKSAELLMANELIAQNVYYPPERYRQLVVSLDGDAKRIASDYENALVYGQKIDALRTEMTSELYTSAKSVYDGIKDPNKPPLEDILAGQAGTVWEQKIFGDNTYSDTVKSYAKKITEALDPMPGHEISRVSGTENYIAGVDYSDATALFSIDYKPGEAVEEAAPSAAEAMLDKVMVQVGGMSEDSWGSYKKVYQEGTAFVENNKQKVTDVWDVVKVMNESYGEAVGTKTEFTSTASGKNLMKNTNALGAGLKEMAKKIESTPFAPVAPILEYVGEGAQNGVTGANKISGLLYESGTGYTQIRLSKSYPELTETIAKDSPGNEISHIFQTTIMDSSGYKIFVAGSPEKYYVLDSDGAVMHPRDPERNWYTAEEYASMQKVFSNYSVGQKVGDSKYPDLTVEQLVGLSYGDNVEITSKDGWFGTKVETVSAFDIKSQANAILSNQMARQTKKGIIAALNVDPDPSWLDTVGDLVFGQKYDESDVDVAFQNYLGDQLEKDPEIYEKSGMINLYKQFETEIRTRLAKGESAADIMKSYGVGGSATEPSAGPSESPSASPKASGSPDASASPGQTENADGETTADDGSSGSGKPGGGGGNGGKSGDDGSGGSGSDGNGGKSGGGSGDGSGDGSSGSSGGSAGGDSGGSSGYGPRNPNPPSPYGPRNPSPSDPAPTGPYGPRNPNPPAPLGPRQPTPPGPFGPRLPNPPGPLGPRLPTPPGPNGPRNPNPPAPVGPRMPGPEGPPGGGGSSGRTGTEEGTQNVKKPNIYLYPERDERISVQLLNPQQLTKSIPAYGNGGLNGWRVLAQPDGSLVNEADGSANMFLFYEADVNPVGFQLDAAWSIPSSQRRGAMMEMLEAYGFNAVERQDFMNYWLTQLDPDLNWLAYPQTTDVCDRLCPIVVTPEPDSVLRLWFVFVPSHGVPAALAPETPVVEPILRDGFTLVEWGGVSPE